MYVSESQACITLVEGIIGMALVGGVAAVVAGLFIAAFKSRARD